MHIKENISVLIDMARGALRMVPLRKMTLIERRHEYENVVTFVFKPKRRLDYKAGQYGVWFNPRFVKGKPVRLFSLASAPTEDTIQISTHISDSDYKQKLDKLSPGDSVYFKGPVGRFVVGNETKKAVFIAGGIGITAVHSIVKDIALRNLRIRTTVIHSSSDEYLYQKDVREYADIAVFTDREALPSLIKKAVERHDEDTEYYVSGPPGFVDTVTKQLKENGVTSIKSDGFLGY